MSVEESVQVISTWYVFPNITNCLVFVFIQFYFLHSNNHLAEPSDPLTSLKLVNLKTKHMREPLTKRLKLKIPKLMAMKQLLFLMKFLKKPLMNLLRQRKSLKSPRMNLLSQRKVSNQSKSLNQRKMSNQRKMNQSKSLKNPRNPSNQMMKNNQNPLNQKTRSKNQQKILKNHQNPLNQKTKPMKLNPKLQKSTTKRWLMKLSRP